MDDYMVLIKSIYLRRSSIELASSIKISKYLLLFFVINLVLNILRFFIYQYISNYYIKIIDLIEFGINNFCQIIYFSILYFLVLNVTKFLFKIEVSSQQILRSIFLISYLRPIFRSEERRVGKECVSMFRF